MLGFAEIQGVPGYADDTIDRGCHYGNRRHAVLRGSNEFRADNSNTDGCSTYADSCSADAIANGSAANAYGAATITITHSSSDSVANGCSANGAAGEHTDPIHADVRSRCSPSGRHPSGHV